MNGGVQMNITVYMAMWTNPNVSPDFSSAAVMNSWTPVGGVTPITGAMGNGFQANIMTVVPATLAPGYYTLQVNMARSSTITYKACVDVKVHSSCQLCPLFFLSPVLVFL